MYIHFKPVWVSYVEHRRYLKNKYIVFSYVYAIKFNIVYTSNSIAWTQTILQNIFCFALKNAVLEWYEGE